MNTTLLRHGFALALALIAGSSMADTLPAARSAEAMRTPAIASAQDRTMSKADTVQMTSTDSETAVK